MRFPRAGPKRAREPPAVDKPLATDAEVELGRGDATLRAVNFGTWHELGDARSAAPADPGVLQARAAAPRPYPTGKSAMIFYGASAAGETLKAYVAGQAGAAALDRARALGASLVRFGVTLTPGDELARLLRGFGERFGAVPAANDPLHHHALPSPPSSKNGAPGNV